jgi:hypothetical protein
MEHEKGLGCLSNRYQHNRDSGQSKVGRRWGSPNETVQELVRRVEVVPIFIQPLRDIERKDRIGSHKEKVALRQMSSWTSPWEKKARSTMQESLERLAMYLRPKPKITSKGLGNVAGSSIYRSGRNRSGSSQSCKIALEQMRRLRSMWGGSAIGAY